MTGVLGLDIIVLLQDLPVMLLGFVANVVVVQSALKTTDAAIEC